MTKNTISSFRRSKLFYTSLMGMAYMFCGMAQEKNDSIVPIKESDFYEIKTVPIPEGIVLGVGGMALLPNDKLAVSTRRGEVWTISNPYMKDGLSLIHISEPTRRTPI